MQNEIKIRVECNLPVLQISLTNDSFGADFDMDDKYSLYNAMPFHFF